MTTARDIRLSPQDQALKLATADAVHAAGGQTFVAKEVGRAQSVVSDWCSPNTASFMPLDVVRRVEALGAGSPGHPHITRALSRAAGFEIDGSPRSAAGLEDLGDHLAALVREQADLVQALAGQDLSAACARLSPLARARIGREADELCAQLGALRDAIDGAPAAAEPIPIRPRRPDSS